MPTHKTRNTISRFLPFFVFIAICIAAIGALAFWQQEKLFALVFFRPTPTTALPGLQYIEQKNSGESGAAAQPSMEVIATGLEVPWEVVTLPDGKLLITERPGRVVLLDPTDTQQKILIAELPEVRETAEGGLLGLALHPRFEENRWVYLYMTTTRDGKKQNVIERFTLKDNTLQERTPVLAGIASSIYHDGGRIVFGPDDYLYVAVGDASNPESAQDTQQLTGKILRLTDTGAPAPGNPFNNAVYSFGHRNPQGLAWDSQGRLWSSEHGPSGPESGHDELNLIVAGGNYGWPTVRGIAKDPRFLDPAVESGKSDTWAPAGLVYQEGKLFFPGLRAERLYEVAVNEDGSVGPLIAHFANALGRLRTISLGKDGFFYLTTSNRDARGTAKDGDDKILRIDPRVFGMPATQ